MKVFISQPMRNRSEEDILIHQVNIDEVKEEFKELTKEKGE